MKVVKKILSIMLVIVMGLGMLPTAELSAAEQPYDVVKTMHIHPNEERKIKLSLKNSGERISGLKTSSKNLRAKVTQIEDCRIPNIEKYETLISVIALKDGEFSLNFDIASSDGKTVSSHTVKVIVNNKYAVKRVSYAGKKIKGQSFMNLTDKKSGKFSVVMNQGYSLKKIELVSNGNPNGRQVKNNSRITLDDAAYSYENNYDGIYSMTTSVVAWNDIIIYFKDKYSGEIESETYTIAQAAK